MSEKYCDRGGDEHGPAIPVKVTTMTDKKYYATLCEECIRREQRAGNWVDDERR